MCAALEPAFVEGWRSLPDEIKVEILKYNLTDPNDAYTYSHFDSYCDQECMLWRNKPEFTLLKATKEISGLAIEVFYNYNTFLVQRTNKYLKYRFGLKVLRYPPRQVNHMIRNLQIRIDPTIRDWNFLSRLSRGVLGFRNLQQVSVTLDPSGTTTSRLNLQRLGKVMQGATITFSVRKLEVAYFHAYLHQYSDRVDQERVQILEETIEPLLAVRLTIKISTITRAPKQTVEKDGPQDQASPTSLRRCTKRIFEY